MPFSVRTLIPVLLAVALPTAAAHAQDSLKNEGSQQDVRPGAQNPIRNPQNLTIFNSDDIGLFAAQNTVKSTTLLDIDARNAALTQWGQTGQKMKTGDPCTTTPQRRLLAGRVVTPKTEQPICLTGFGLSVYTKAPDVGDGSFLGYAFASPTVGISARAFDAASGQMNKSASSDDVRYMQVVVARPDLNAALRVEVVGYTPGENGALGTLGSLGAWTDSSGRKVTGDVALALGDYDDDRSLEILVAADTSTGATGPGRVSLTVFDYDADNAALKVASTLDVTTSAPPRSLALAAGDFGSIGFDQAMLGYYPATAAPKIRLGYFQLGNKLKLDPPQIEADLTAAPAPGSFFEMRPGLFNFDPKAVAGGDAAFGYHVRQLALGWVDTSGTVKTMIANISPAATQIQQSAEVAMTGSGSPTLTDDIGPGLAVGNFIGIQQDNVNPLDQIAVAKANAVSGQSNQSVPELVVAAVSYASGQFSITPKWFNTEPAFQVSGLVWSPGVVALDSRGKSYYLGAPLHIKVPELIDPQYVINMPPRHVDCLVGDGNEDDDGCEIVNVSGDTSFTVQLVDSTDQTLTQTSTDQSSTQLGQDISGSITGTVGGGVAEIAEVEVTSTVKTNFSHESDSVERNVNSKYTEINTTRSATTSLDDHLIWNARFLDIWRFPVYGLDLKAPKQHPYYDILVPGPLTRFSGGGSSMDWYGPRHITNNALSYNAISDSNFPSDVGDFTFKTEGGETKTGDTPLNEGIVRSFDGNQQAFSLDYTTEVGGSTEKSFSYSLANSTDISVGFKASANFEVVNASTDIEAGVTLSSKSSWEQSDLSERSLKNSRGITLDQPEVDGIISKSYNYKSLIYVTENGGLKVAHAVDPLGSNSGRGWWMATYGGTADPALNLPNRLTYADGEWALTAGEDYYRMRGIYLTQNEMDKTTDSYPFLTGGVEEGAKVRVVVRVYNLSIDTDASAVTVSYAYQALDPRTLKPVGDKTVFATSQPLELAPLAMKEVPAIWDTSGLAGPDGTPYRFEITLNTTGPEIHGDDPETGGNNVGIWPWSGSQFTVFKKASRASLDPDRLRPAPRIRIRLAEAGDGVPGITHMAQVTIDSPADDMTARQLVLMQEPRERDGIWAAVASRTLWGLLAGRQTFQIPVDLHDLGARPLMAWLSPGPDDRPARPVLSMPTPLQLGLK